MLNLLLLGCAAICFILSACSVTSKINLMALGLFFWVLTLLIGGLPK